jgi:glycosyltransferase involved in cell wall biosynthesis
MLPFDWRELLRYGFSIKTLRLLSLRFVQTAAFRKATGVIFLSRYAKDSVLNVVGNCTKSTIIAHGLNSRFKQSPREQRPIDIYSVGSPFRILYVSVIELYKHQWHVVEAIAQLRKKTGWPLVLDLVGPAYPKALLRLQSAIDHFDPLKEWVNYHGVIPFNNLHTIYANADLGVFASSCENMPNILLETMASGLPIACSNRASMPEILGDGGMYFDPEIPDEIANALESLISDPKNRNKLAKLSYLASEKYTWKRCADETFAFISDIYHHHAFK